MKKIIMHIDVNNAFLSWSACDMLKHGYKIDIRNINSIIGGDEKQRSGIVLAKSENAKKFGIKTAETIYSAKKKCNNLQVFLPDFRVYSHYSNAMYKILCDYSDKIERFSIDECFLDYTYSQKLFGTADECAKKISNRIYTELGFTVNVGIADNKLLAKMASDLEKPNKICTIYKNEIKDKMWILPIEELFMTGRKSVPKLHNLNIFTIGDLANFDLKILKKTFGKMGMQMYEYANGIDDSEVDNSRQEYKGIGNSITTNVDILNKSIAYNILLSISELVGKRLRAENKYTNVINVQLKSADFVTQSHQRKLLNSTNITKEIYNVAKELFDEFWNGQPIRSFGIRLDELQDDKDGQISFLADERLKEKSNKLDKVIDNTRNKYGNNIIKRAVFLDNVIPNMLNKEK